MATRPFQVGQVILTPTPGVLQRVYPYCDDFATESLDLNIVVVPELGTPTAKSLDALPWKWLARLKDQHSIKPLVAVFEYKIDTEGAPIWQSLVEQGVALPNELLAKEHEIGLFERPLILIGHGMGGIILKKALTYLHGEQYNLKLRHILEVHSATIFLGTPHPTYNRQDRWGLLQYILRSLAKFSKKSLAQAEQEAAIVANISLKFEEAGTKPLVLSAFETKKTKVAGGIFGSRHVVKIQLRLERLVPTRSNHRDICAVDPASRLFGEVASMLQAVLRDPFSPPASSPPPEPNQQNVDEYAWESTVPDAEILSPGQYASKESKDNTKDGIQGTTESSFEVIPSVNEMAQSRPAPKLPCYILGPEESTSEFVGRNEIISDIEKALERPSLSPVASAASATTPRSFAICGTPGIGKSRIATEFMAKHKNSFDAVFWVQADNSNSLADGFMNIATEIQLLSSAKAKDVVIGRNVVMQWLSNPLKQAPVEELEGSVTLAPRADWLLIFDNADDLDVLGDYWPETGPGAVLITSRNPMAKQYRTNKQGCDLQALLEVHSAHLLRNLSGAEHTTENKLDSESLAERLGNLPLALTQVAAIIKRKDMKFKEFIEVLDEDVSQRKLLLEEDGYSHTLSTIWRIDELSTAAKALLNILSLLDRHEIRDTLFESSPPSDLLPGFPTSKLEYYDARDSLAQTSLITKNKNARKMLIHPLLQTVTRARMSSEVLHQAFTTTAGILVGVWPQPTHLFTHETSTWELANQLTPHVIRIADEYEKSADWGISLDAQRDLAELLQSGGWHLAEKGNFITAERMWNISLAICERNAEELEKEYADALFCVSSHMSDTNQFKGHKIIAMKHFEQRMKVEKRNASLGLGAGMAYSEMALAHLLNDEYEEAIPFAEQSRKINEKTPMFLNNDYWPFFAYVHHAQALIGLERYQEAADMIRETIKWRENKYGLDDVESFKLGYALQVMAQIKLRQGHKDESTLLYKRALSNYDKTIGFNHHRTGHVLVALADHEARLGDVELAATLYDKACRVFKNHSHYDPELARTTFKKSQLYQQHGDKDIAPKLREESRLIYRKVVGRPIDASVELTLDHFDKTVAIWAR